MRRILAYHSSVVLISQTVLYYATDTVRDYFMDINPDHNRSSLLDIPVSYDGSWHTLSHSSHYDIGAVCELQTGLILDYEVFNKFCLLCVVNSKQFGGDGEEFKHRFYEHKSSCGQNYDGSSNSMET